jgi:hypothetical protein
VKTSQPLKWNVSSGVLADQADEKYSFIKTMIATPFVIDLTALVDAQGNAMSFARLKSLSWVNRSQTPGHSVAMGSLTTVANTFVGIVSNPGQLTVNNSTPNSPAAFGWISPDLAGSPVSPTNKLISFDPGANTITIEIEAIGASV